MLLSPATGDDASGPADRSEAAVRGRGVAGSWLDSQGAGDVDVASQPCRHGVVVFEDSASHRRSRRLHEDADLRHVEETWIKGDFPPATWTHFDNLGPKTTNLAEGFHNSLNVRLGIPHPSIRSFLHWLQKQGRINHGAKRAMAQGPPP